MTIDVDWDVKPQHNTATFALNGSEGTKVSSVDRLTDRFDMTVIVLTGPLNHKTNKQKSVNTIDAAWYLSFVYTCTSCVSLTIRTVLNFGKHLGLF